MVKTIVSKGVLSIVIAVVLFCAISVSVQDAYAETYSVTMQIGRAGWYFLGWRGQGETVSFDLLPGDKSILLDTGGSLYFTLNGDGSITVNQASAALGLHVSDGVITEKV